MPQLLESSAPWIAAGATLAVGLLLAAIVAAALNVVMRRLLREPETAGRVAGGTFWVLALVAFLVAAGRLAEPAVFESGLSVAAARVLSALPDLVVGVLLLVLGWAVATALRPAVQHGLRRIQPRWADQGAAVVFWAILGLAVLLAAEQVGIAVGLLRTVVLLLIAAALLAAALATGLGARAVAADLIAGRHVTGVVELGDELEVAGHRGVVVAVGRASIRLHTAADTHVEVPHHVLLAHPWTRYPAPEEPLA